jgi:hypothetical protein
MSVSAEAMSMRSNAYRIGMVFSLLVLSTVLAFEGAGLAKRFGLAPEQEPVLVFVIEDLESARRVRAAIRQDRILWQGELGLALVGGRVIASSLDDAADVIEEAGWVESPVQIVKLAERSRSEESPGDVSSSGERLARLRQLVNKPSLSRVEQVFVLQAMNDGLEI